MLDKRTYQMCGIAGMNDKSEIDYFDKKYSKSKQNAMSLEVWNKIYLSSGTIMKDDLTMWRLYGDDGKGVCLEFDVTLAKSENFYMAKVDYENKKKSHKWVKVIKDLEKVGLKFNNLNVWKHFFKPHEYSVEKEIRLVFMDSNINQNPQRAWILANGSSIVIPVMRFDFLCEHSPLKLRKIILGPKMSEYEINKAQLESMLSSKSISGIGVECSKISNYR